MLEAMSKAGKIATVTALVLAIGAVMLMKASKRDDERVDTTQVAGDRKLPRLMELGSVSCIPCKMMAPILDELKEEYAGRLSVEFIDVREDPEAAKKFGIEAIPTQIFLDSSGKELFRHEGLFSREDILAKWEELGVEIGTDE